VLRSLVIVLLVLRNVLLRCKGCTAIVLLLLLLLLLVVHACLLC
jgi:hypothetical protein